MSRGPVTPCHLGTRAVLSAYGDVFVRNGEWRILVPFSFPKMSSHIDLCVVEEMHGTVERTMGGNNYGHANLFPQWLRANDKVTPGR